MAKLSPDFVLLGLLECQSCHGYQLLEHFRDPARLGNVWNLSTSQLYNILKRLENKELVDGREEDSVDAPMRTVYWLTDTGRQALHAWLDESNPSASTRHIRTEFLSRLYIARRLNYPTTHIVTAQREAVTTYRDQLIQERDGLANSAGYLALDLRVGEMDLIMDWLTRCEKTFTSEPTS